ncbi:ABC transporter ATP-binding protein [Streptomyces sp. JJ66]|uniref:ABC transporter ATP-binding protein n=1 Tax=Streptomyces sp. JJ66 TaxID=2803843 RepID=UPI001C58EC31|nr:ABC transporter ATP-binding protein [Streptomyces sp. JJ66]MBW1602626.1 ABC transporter ATP-binding protein [Streptomyces sp. JJ66]
MELDIQAGRSVAITGPSGSGKSTLLSCVLGLVRPAAGSIKVAGMEMAKLSGRHLAEHRSAHIGMVFQFGELLPELSPVDNVALAALLAGVGKEQAYEQASDLLQQLGVAEAETCQHLSGGERQRTAVARALINKPSLLLADEPTGALDTETREKVADVLFSTPQRYGCGLLLVTHDHAVAARADQVLTLRNGVLGTEAVTP